MSFVTHGEYLEYLRKQGLEEWQQNPYPHMPPPQQPPPRPLALQDPPNLIRESMGEMHAKLQGMNAKCTLDVYVTIDGKVCGEYEAEQSKSYGHVGTYSKYIDRQQFFDDVMLTWKYLSAGVSHEP